MVRLRPQSQGRPGSLVSEADEKSLGKTFKCRLQTHVNHTIKRARSILKTVRQKLFRFYLLLIEY